MGKASIPPRRATGAAAPLLLVLALAGCKDPGSNRTLSRPLQAQNQYSGGTRGGGRPSEPSAEWMMEQERLIAEKKAADAEAANAQGLDPAQALWRKAESERSPDDAADDYKTI